MRFLPLLPEPEDVSEEDPDDEDELDEDTDVSDVLLDELLLLESDDELEVDEVDFGAKRAMQLSSKMR